jgi:transcriptional regulator with XRE-family HTH domain
MSPDEFKMIRIKRSYTKKSLGKRIDLSPQKINRYETGKCEIPSTVSDLMRILSAHPKLIGEQKLYINNIID